MVKAMVWIAMAVGMLGGLYGVIHVMNADSGILLGVAVSPADTNGQCEIQLVVPKLMALSDGPPAGPNFKPDWNLWLDQHLDLRDEAGTRMTFRKGGFKTKQITEMQTGAAQFIALATVDTDKPYTFTVTPVLGKPEKYTCHLDGHEQAFRRLNFDPDY